MNINHDAASSFFFSSLFNRGVDAAYPMHNSNRSSSSDSTNSSDSNDDSPVSFDSSTDSDSNDSSTSTDGPISSMDDHDDVSDDDSSMLSIAGEFNKCKGKESFASLAFQCITNNCRRIMSIAPVQYGSRSDKHILFGSIPL